MKTKNLHRHVVTVFCFICIFLYFLYIFSFYSDFAEGPAVSEQGAPTGGGHGPATGPPGGDRLGRTGPQTSGEYSQRHHGLSQQGVFLDTQTLKKHPSGHPNLFVKNFLKCQSQAYN